MGLTGSCEDFRCTSLDYLDNSLKVMYCPPMKQKRILVLGGGGFIGGHLVNRLESAGNWVRSVDIKRHSYGAKPSEFQLLDLRERESVELALKLPDGLYFHEVYQLAADMGGAGYIFTGDNDANVMHNSALINLNLLEILIKNKDLSNLPYPKVFYSSSACVYPEEKQLETSNPGLKETDAYPANPDSEYGWEKIFSERLYLSFARNYGLPVRIARFHNIFGPEGTWMGGKEKAPAAICRKVAASPDEGTIEIWGDGEQTRSFLFIEECLDAVEKLMSSNLIGPVNIGSEEMVSINHLVRIAMSFENKNLKVVNIPGPQGVRGRNSNNSLIREKLGWDYTMKLEQGLSRTYFWIKEQINLQSFVERPSI